MGLRPDLIVRQVFRTAQPVVPASTLPAVLVGVHRQLEYRKSAGSFVGGQDNGDYNFPDLIALSAVEPTTQAEAELRPKVYISNQFGVADITDDVTFQNLDNPATIPIFNIAAGAEATFEAAVGTTGGYSATTGKFIDANADFIEAGIGAADVIKVSGVDAFAVSSLDSDDELTVTRINHGPADALVQLGAKDAFDVRVLTYLGTVDETSGFAGFVSGGTKVGELVTFDGWNERTTTGGLEFDATDANGHRTVTSSGDFNPANVAVGDVIVIQEGTSVEMPAFVITDPTGSGNDDAEVANLTSLLNTTAVAGGTSDFPERFFQTYEFNTAVRRTPSATGFFSAQNGSGLRTFTDTAADFGATTLPAVGDWIVVFDADTGVIASGITYAQAGGGDTITRSAGSFLADGFAAGMKILIRASATTDPGLGEYTILSVTATVITLVEATTITAGSGTNVEITSTAMTPMFEINTAPTLGSGATTLEVADITPGLIAAAQIGGPLRYSILRPSAISTSASDYAEVGAVDGTTELRYLEWFDSTGAEVAFTPTTMPVVGDFVFNDEGVLLFDVTKAIRTTVAEHTSIDVDDGNREFTRSAGSWVDEGWVAGDVFQVVNAEDSANDGTYLVSGVTATVLTVDATTPPTTANAADTTIEFQLVGMVDHTQAGYNPPDTDVFQKIGLSIREADAAAYSVVRVVSETEINVRHVTSGDEVANQTVVGMTTLITVGDTLANVSYSIEKTLTGGALTGDVLVTYSARRTDHADELMEVTQGTVEEIAGLAVPGNPMGLAAANAVNNTNVPVLLAQVASDDIAGWTAALALIQTDQVYAVAPLTQTEARLVEFQNHVNLESQPEQKRERILFQSSRFETQITRWTLDNTSASFADLIYDGTNQSLVVDHSGGLVALGAKAGDVVEGTFSGYIPGQGFISGTLSARVVDVDESGNVTTFTLLPDTTVPVTLAGGVRMTSLDLKSKVLSSNQLRDTIAAYPGAIQDRRVRNIYADRCLITFSDVTNPNDNTTGFYGGGEVTGYEVGGWLIAAIVAAQRSGLTASTPLTKRPISGIQRLVMPFTSLANLDIILDAGNYLMTQPTGENGGVEAVRAVTTDVSDLNFLEESVTVQIDNFARRLRKQVVPILGSAKLDENFFDMFSAISSSVVNKVRDIDKDIRELDLVEIREDPDRADTFLASYTARPFFSAAQGDITIFI
mgnify:CR=1 FL=1